ncbi:MAG: AEC family transporter [Rhodobacteraceae bacterium]|nr:AEC family transporter [Paracoccaceae bacterium]
MLFVIQATLPVFIVVILGFGLRKSGFVGAANWTVVEDLCFYLLFPALLALTMIEADLSSMDTGAFTLTLVTSVAIIGGAVLALWPLLRRKLGTGPGQFSTIYQTVTRWHGFIALAIVLNLYGADGAALIAIIFAVLVPILQVTNIMVLAAFSDSKADYRHVLLVIFKNPLIWGIGLGLAINASGINVWPTMLSTLDLLGRAALGMSLLALGAGLSLKAAMRPSKELLIAVVGKLLFTPLVMLSVGYAFGITGLERDVLLIAAAVPTAMNGFVLARKMGGDAELYATISTVQTVVSFFTIPLLLWLTTAG